jgi:hypothetical protein
MKRNAFDKDMCGDYFQYVYSILSCKSVLVFSFVGSHELICFLKEPIVTAKRNGYVELVNVIHQSQNSPEGIKDGAQGASAIIMLTLFQLTQKKLN